MNMSLSNTLTEPGIIPFADESGAGTSPDVQRSPADLGASAREEFGELSRPMSVVDRDLGLESLSQQASRGRYACPCCGQGAKRVMRVRVVSPQHGHSRWVALCAVCAASMLAKVPGTIVGGMVRPSRRRRTNRSRVAQQGQPGFGSLRDTRYRQAG